MLPALLGHGSSGLFQDRASGLGIVAPHEKLKAHPGPRYGPIHPAARISLHGRIDASGIEGADCDIGLLPVTERVNDDEVSLAHVPILRPCPLMEGAIIRPQSREGSFERLRGGGHEELEKYRVGARAARWQRRSRTRANRPRLDLGHD